MGELDRSEVPHPEAAERRRERDPRLVAVAGTVLAASVVAALASVLLGISTRSRHEIDHVRSEVDAPLDRIDQILDAASDGQMHLQLAAATTGAERSRHLEAAIAGGEATAQAWTEYEAVALPLRGEPALAGRYRRDYVHGKEVAADAIIPILATDAPGVLPSRQLEAAGRNRSDLQALRRLYQQERSGALLRLDAQAATADRQLRLGALACLVSIVVLGLAALRTTHRTVQTRRRRARAAELVAIARIQRQASRDPLTGLINRRTLEREVEGLQAAGLSYAVAFADLDHFKRLNDAHGHHAGDRALRSFAGTLTDGLRAVDLVCRWGGEEFVVVLPECDALEAAEAMDRVRLRLRVDHVGNVGEVGPPVTVSVGVADQHPGEVFGDTVVRADAALAAAKKAGRDRVELWAPPVRASLELSRPA